MSVGGRVLERHMVHHRMTKIMMVSVSTMWKSRVFFSACCVCVFCLSVFLCGTSWFCLNRKIGENATRGKAYCISYFCWIVSPTEQLGKISSDSFRIVGIQQQQQQKRNKMTLPFTELQRLVHRKLKKRLL